MIKKVYVLILVCILTISTTTTVIARIEAYPGACQALEVRDNGHQCYVADHGFTYDDTMDAYAVTTSDGPFFQIAATYISVWCPSHEGGLKSFGYSFFDGEMVYAYVNISYGHSGGSYVIAQLTAHAAPGQKPIFYPSVGIGTGCGVTFGGGAN